MIDRRSFLATKLSGMMLVAAAPGISWAAANTDKRFVFIIQRGGADGLATLAPVGDPNFLPARGAYGEEALTGRKLDGFFALHNNLGGTAKLFGQGEASFVHATGLDYRNRSHFDAQNILESGARSPYGRKDGWINRLLKLLPENQSKAVAVAPAVPVAMRGPQSVTSYEQSRRRGASDELKERVAMLYSEDAELGRIWADVVQTEAMVGRPDNNVRGGEATGKLAADLMQGPAGARVLMLETNGWDTHSRQSGGIKSPLSGLDAIITTLRANLGAEWKSTLVIVATEFGRTVKFNGTQGTDHGTGSVAMLFGGSLKNGGSIEADWPGLAKESLYEGRDLRSTRRFDDFVTEALSHHYAIDRKLVKRVVFPDFV